MVECIINNSSYFAEVPVFVKDTLEIALGKSKKLLGLGFSTLVFPDRARADSNVMTISDLINLNIFSKINSDNLLPILATRTKHPEEIDQIAEALKKQNVKNLFIVTGDPHKTSRTSFLTSLDVIPKLANDFTIGAVAHVDATSVNRDIKKIDAGAKFLIAQACYDQFKWNEWINKAIAIGINKKVQIYQTIIPLTNKIILENMHSLHDVSLPEDLYNELSAYSDDALKEYGKNAAIAQIKQIRQSNFFSGVYIYCRDLDVINKIIS